MPTKERKFRTLVRKRPNAKTVLTEGDSWFDLPIGGKNVVDHIESMTEYNILREEKTGDQLLQVLSGKQKVKLRRYFSTYKFDALLFSAGGNDFAGPDLNELLRVPPKNNPNNFLIKDRIDNKMQLIKCAYKELISIRDDYSPYTFIFSSCYDYIIPTGIPAKLFGRFPVGGPWVKPILDYHQCHDPEKQKKFIAYIIDSFAKVIEELSQEHERFVFIDTRNTIEPYEWQDELHPNKVASKKIAKLFIEELEKI